MSQLQGDSSVSSFPLQLLGKKQHIRALLIDRVLLQHEVGVNNAHTLRGVTDVAAITSHMK